MLIIRIAWINIKSGDAYAKQVLSQQTYDSRAVPYRRGEIQDRNGNLLAKSEKVYNVVLDCKAVNSNDDYVEPTIQVVSDQLGLDTAEIREIVSSEQTRDSRYQVVKKGLSLEEVQKFEDYTDTGEDRKDLSDSQREWLQNVQGVWFEEDYIRNYPLGSLACTVIGFSNRLNDGISGLEAYYSDTLNGVNGRQYGYLNEKLELQENIIEPENGSSIVTTIDVNVQQVVEKYIAELEQQNKNGPQPTTKGRASANTAIVVANPNNGEILAMATDRVFDLNDPQNLSGWVTKKEQSSMTEEQKTEALNKLWYNYCVSEAFELGSTYKPIVVSSALDAGSIDSNFAVTCIGYLQPVIEEDPINCTSVHGAESLGDILKNSCNPGMMTIAMKMGIDKFCEYQSVFGFGRKTGIDLPNENSGTLDDENTMGIIELCTYSFGQGFTATMLQELSAFCADVNGGYLYQPHVVKQIVGDNGEVLKTIEPLVVGQPVSTKTSGMIRQYLETVVSDDGTAKDAQIAGYRIGGKTGTAEKLPRNNGKYIVSYICAVPIDDPQVVVYGVIDEANVDDQEHAGTYIRGAITGILKEILPYLGVYPSGDITEVERADLGMKVERETEETEEMEVQYVYDEYGNLMYDETTWQPLTELVPVEKETEEAEEAGNVQEDVWTGGDSDGDVGNGYESQEEGSAENVFGVG
ncbi:MAG: penicillin-binding transpeptidase domain-containing protein [Eubacteriales bacterium]|nr:penicillin-binding transpeptidase domain-containing protein [Eubacteriales bacterium]